MEIMENGYYRPFSGAILMPIIIIVCVLTVIAIVVNALMPMLIMAKPDKRNDKEIEIAGNNSQGLSRAVLDGNKLLVQRANGVSQLGLDVITFAGNKKKKHSYNISFNGEYAAIDLESGVTEVKLVVLYADGRIVNKKKIGYSNDIVNIVTSVIILVGVGITVLLNALYHNEELEEYNAGYGILFYVVPFIIGAVLGAANFFLTKILTKSFNKGGR